MVSPHGRASRPRARALASITAARTRVPPGQPRTRDRPHSGWAAASASTRTKRRPRAESTTLARHASTRERRSRYRRSATPPGLPSNTFPSRLDAWALRPCRPRHLSRRLSTRRCMTTTWLASSTARARASAMTLATPRRRTSRFVRPSTRIAPPPSSSVSARTLRCSSARRSARR